MNSLAWLLTPRSREGSPDREPGRKVGKGKGKAPAAPVELAHGPREEESEKVDELLGDLERSRGRAVANMAERKASMGKDGTVRLGLPGIIERKRVKGLELALDGGERQSELQEDGEVAKEPSSGPLPSTPLSAPPLASVDLPPLPPSPTLKDRAELATDDPTPPATPPSPTLTSSTPSSPALSAPALKPAQPHLVVEQRSRIVASSRPVRWTVRLYLLIRRFLSMFRLASPRLEEPVAIEEKAPLLRVEDTDRTPYFSFLRRNDRRVKHRGRSESIASSEGGSDSDSSMSGRRWFSVPFSKGGTPLRSGTPTPDAAGKEAGAKKLEALMRRPKTLVLDLDETLIHSTSRLGGMGGVAASASGWGTGSAGGLKVRVIEVVLDGRIVVYHVYKRPWVDFFLKKVSSWYTIVIFTASLREYADPVIDWLDAGRGIIGGRLFRESCTNIGGSYVKDLAIVDPDLSQVCLVDNSPVSYGINQANGIPIEGWLNDPQDEGLLDLLPMLDSLRFTNDVRRILGLRGFAAAVGATGVYRGAGRRR